jgi:hypothetical protein
VTFRRRRAALRLGVAGALGLAPPVVDVAAGPARLAGGAQRPVGAAPVPDVAGAFLLLAENALWLTRRGERTRLASGTGGWLQDPAWAPDGTQVSYTHFQVRVATAATAPGGVPWPSGEVFGVRPDAAGAAPRPLLRREALNEALVSATWSPDGRALYAVRRRPLGPSAVQADLVRLDLDTGAVAVQGTPSGAIAVTEVTEVAAGPDGAVAVVGVTGPAVTGLPDLALVVRGPDGPARGVASTAPGADPPGLGFLSLPRFSPDGRRLVFAAGDGPGGGPGDGPGAAVVPALPGMAVAPALRGALGARPASAHGLRGWLWVADLQTGALRRLPTGGHDDLGGIAWLPDGEHLLLLDVSGVGVVALADGTLTRLPEATAGLAATALAYAPNRS